MEGQGHLRISLEGLMHDMGLDTSAKKYWRARAKKWDAGSSGDMDDRSDNEDKLEEEHEWKGKESVLFGGSSGLERTTDWWEIEVCC